MPSKKRPWTEAEIKLLELVRDPAIVGKELGRTVNDCYRTMRDLGIERERGGLCRDGEEPTKPPTGELPPVGTLERILALRMRHERGERLWEE